MSKYTTELRFLCETMCEFDESQGQMTVNNIVNEARLKIFDFDYPIFADLYKPVIETKILKHFYTREIGAETYGLWKLWLDTRMNEIMPYYNKLYESAMLEFNPLYDTDITTDKSGGTNGHKTDVGNTSGTKFELTHNDYGSETKDTGSNTDEGWDVGHSENHDDADDWQYYSDTPQGGVDGLADMTYLTNATHNTRDDDGSVDSNGSYNHKTTLDTQRNIGGSSDGKVDGNSSGHSDMTSDFHNTEQFIEHIVGKRGGASFSQMIKEFRETFLNIDMMVIHELDDLFMNLW